MNSTIVRRTTAERTYRWVALALAAIIYSCTLTYPFNNDNALYAYMADLLLHGRLPYLGSWDQNFPGVLLVHAAPLLIGLRSQFAFHVWDVILQLISSYYIFQILSKLFDARTALLGVLLVALYYIQQGLWMAGERDTYATLLTLAAFYLTIDGHSGNNRWALIGSLIGLAILFRPTYGLFAIGYLLWIILDRAAPIKSRLSLAAKFSISVALPILLLTIIYALAGGLTDLWLAVIQFNFKIYSGHGEQFSFFDPVRFYAISLPAVAICIWAWWHEGSRRLLLLWAILFLSSVVSLIVLYRHSVYHYHPAMVLFLMMSAVGWQWLAERVARGRALVTHLLIAIVVLFFTFQTLRGNTIQYVLRDLIAGRIHSIDSMYAYFEGSPTFGELVQREVGEYLKQHTSRGDVAQMFGPYSFPQYFARLTTASRFQTAHAILMRGSGDSLQPFQKEWRKEYLADMLRNKPVYFIVCDAPEAFRQYYGGLLGHEVLAKDFTELSDWLNDHYHRDTVIGAFTLYRSNQ